MNRTRPIRILHVLSQLGIGGLELQALELCRRLDKSKYRVYCCPLRPQYDLRDEMTNANVTVVNIHKRSTYDISVIPRLVGFLRSENIDIVHTWIFTSNCWGRVSAILAGTPVVVAAERNVDTWKCFYHRWIDRALARYSHVVLANSGAVHGYIVNQEGIPSGKVRTIYNGVDNARYAGTGVSREAAREQFGLPKDATVIGTVANLSPWKDYPNLLGAARIVCDRRPNVAFAIVGTGRMEPSLRDLSRSLSLDQNVFFLGSQRSIPLVLRSFDIFALPSQREGFANVILEAMSSGLPVVATDVGGNREAIVQGQTGLLVPSANAHALAEALLELANDPVLCQRMGSAGQQHVAGAFSMERMAEAYDRLYTELLPDAK